MPREITVVRTWRSSAGRVALCCLLAAMALPFPARAQFLHSPFEEIARIDQKLDSQVPLGLAFRDEMGKTVRLGDYFGQKPVVLALVYYECPMLCTLVMNGMLTSFQQISFDVGKQFEVLTVSINPKETPSLAARKKQSYAAQYGRPGGLEGWHFLTQDPDAPNDIHELADSVGFRYAFDERTAQYVHAAGIMVLTPQGRTSRYFYGLEYAPRDMRLGLVEASGNKIGSRVDQMLLLCYHYDPQKGKYGVVIQNVIRLTGGLTVLLLGTLIAVLLRRERRQRQAI
jgi:protein SCO1